MENSKVIKRTPQEGDNHKIYANKIYTRFFNTVKEISASLDKFEIGHDEDEILFQYAVNDYYRELCVVVFYLRQVIIKMNDDNEGVRDLQTVITAMNQIVLSIQGSLNLDIKKLKINLEDSIIQVGSQVEKLMKMIECDQLQEHKQKLLDSQFDLLIFGEALKLHIQYGSLSVPELHKLLFEAIGKYKSTLIQFKGAQDVMVEDFSHYSRRVLQYIQNKVDYMRKFKNTENCHKDIVHTFDRVEDLCLKNFSDFLKALDCVNPLQSLLVCIDTCEKRVEEASAELQKGFQSIMAKDIGKNDNEILFKQLIIHLFICGINSICIWSQSIEDAIMKRTD